MNYIRSIQKLLLENTEEYDEDHHDGLNGELQHSTMQYHTLNRLHQNAPESYKSHLEHAKNAALDTVAEDHANLIHYSGTHKNDPHFLGAISNDKLLAYLESTQKVHDNAKEEYDFHVERNLEDHQ